MEFSKGGKKRNIHIENDLPQTKTRIFLKEYRENASKKLSNYWDLKVNLMCFSNEKINQLPIKRRDNTEIKYSVTRFLA